MIRVFKSDSQDEKFYAKMGKYFASLEVAKELERQVYNKENTTWYVSTIHEKVIGFASVYDSGKYYFLDNLYVTPLFRNRRNAREIISNIIDDFSDKPIKCIVNNPYAIRIFEQFGFCEDGKIGKYKKYIKYQTSIL